MNEKVENRAHSNLFRCQRCKNQEYHDEGDTHYCKVCGQKMIPYPKYSRPNESEE